MGEGIDGVAGESGHALGEDQIDFSGKGVSDHAFKALAVSGGVDGEYAVGVDDDLYQVRERVLVIPVVEAEQAGTDPGEVCFSDLGCPARVAFAFGGGFAPPELVCRRVAFLGAAVIEPATDRAFDPGVLLRRRCHRRKSRRGLGLLVMVG